MIKRAAIPLIIVLGVGLTAGLAYFGQINSISPAGHGSSTTGGVSNQPAPKVGDFFPYACGQPAIFSQLLCDKLSPNYVVLPPLPNSPRPVRPGNMSDSAWTLLQKTYGNGVCDPNETWWTSPLDCAASGNAVQDPYTGRPGAAAAVCQLLPEHQVPA